MHKILAICFQPTFLVLTLICSTAYCQSDVESLLNDLGSREFLTRERASRQLLQLGDAVVEPLRHLPNSLSKESRERAFIILRTLEKQSLAKTSQEFLAQGDDAASCGLPSWDAFRNIIGSSRYSKLLFLEFVKRHSKLAEQVELLDRARKSNQNTVALEDSLSTMAAAIANQLMDSYQVQGSLEIGDDVALMFTTAMIDQKAPMEVSELIRSNSQLGFAGYMHRPGFKPCLLKLMSEWIPKSPDSMAMEVMGMAYYMNLPSVMPIARKHLSKSFDPFTREQAIICIAKFGDRSDVETLLKWSSDTTIVHKFLDLATEEGAIAESLGLPPGIKPAGSTGSAPPQKLVRINDLSTAVAMILSSENPKSVFPNYIADRFATGWRSAVAVPESDQQARDMAIRAWTAKHSAVESEPEPSLLPVQDPNP